MAKTGKGEVSMPGARIVKCEGIYSSVLTAIQPWAWPKMLADKKDWEKKEYFKVTFPHGNDNTIYC